MIPNSKTKNKNNYLIGAVGTGTAFGIISSMRSVWGNSLNIIGTDINPSHLVTSSLLLDKFIQVPKAGTTEYLDILKRILISENIGSYIPILNEEIALASQLSKMLEYAHINFFANEIYADCLNKVFASQLMTNNNIPTPELRKVKHINLEKEWFVKPIYGVGSVGAYKSFELELQKMDSNLVNALMVQELCEEPEITVDSFYDFMSAEGVAYARERIETKSGVCTKAAIYQDPEISRLAREIGIAIKQRGSICFQLMRLNNRWVVTDLNLRPGAGTSMTCAAGFDVIAAGIACWRGEKFHSYVPKLSQDSRVVVTRQYSNFVMTRS